MALELLKNACVAWSFRVVTSCAVSYTHNSWHSRAEPAGCFVKEGTRYTLHELNHIKTTTFSATISCKKHKTLAEKYREYLAIHCHCHPSAWTSLKIVTTRQPHDAARICRIRFPWCWAALCDDMSLQSACCGDVRPKISTMTEAMFFPDCCMCCFSNQVSHLDCFWQLVCSHSLVEMCCNPQRQVVVPHNLSGAEWPISLGSEIWSMHIDSIRSFKTLRCFKMILDRWFIPLFQWSDQGRFVRRCSGTNQWWSRRDTLSPFAITVTAIGVEVLKYWYSNLNSSTRQLVSFCTQWVMEMRHFAPSSAAKFFGTAAAEGANCWMMSDRDDVTLGPHDVGTHAEIV